MRESPPGVRLRCGKVSVSPCWSSWPRCSALCSLCCLAGLGFYFYPGQRRSLADVRTQTWQLLSPSLQVCVCPPAAPLHSPGPVHQVRPVETRSFILKDSAAGRVQKQTKRWYVVWQLFLSKFKFLRELVGDASTPQAETQPSETKSERTASAPTRNRPKTTRQRVAFSEGAS
ncbi:hypothetical protein L3Q82_015186 [Scortum barcoo]|uniref:Uncharacterized protein n=1 Tax=Scortum barcoo TaxID=214431 RepID=A0ACB8VTC6_9TELE|nr:hypothetical protein L3Q82_015186 [Scortum barcoo]